MKHGVRVPPAEFTATVDRASYVIPTVGIVAIACIAAALVASIVGMAIGASIRAASRAGWEEPVLAAWIISAGFASGGWWVRRRRRIHHERKLVIDRDGITYVAFADQSHRMRWTDIVGVEEQEEYGPGEGMSLIYRLGDRKFVVRDSDFEGYSDIRQLTMAYLPSRTIVLPRG